MINKIDEIHQRVYQISQRDGITNRHFYEKLLIQETAKEIFNQLDQNKYFSRSHYYRHIKELWGLK